MKKLFLLTSLVATVAWAADFSLSIEDFQNNSLFDYVEVTKAEKVFADELIGEDLYQVTYWVEGECAPAGEVDACESVPYCEYIWVRQTSKGKKPLMEGTQKDCNTAIEDITNPQLIDEY